MLNFLWAGMILAGLLAAIFTGNIKLITNGAVDSAVEAVSICIKMAGTVALWNGLMRIAEKSGLIAGLAKKMRPVLGFLFPRVDGDSAAAEYISANFIANIFGLGWAATPAGLRAMEELQKLNPRKSVATREMCTFMIINMSSLQLVTMNIISYRAQYNSANPSEIIGPGLFATLISSAAAVLLCKLFDVYSDIKETGGRKRL